MTCQNHLVCDGEQQRYAHECCIPVPRMHVQTVRAKSTREACMNGSVGECERVCERVNERASECGYQVQHEREVHARAGGADGAACCSNAGAGPWNSWLCFDVRIGPHVTIYDQSCMHDHIGPTMWRRAIIVQDHNRIHGSTYVQERICMCRQMCGHLHRCVHLLLNSRLLHTRTEANCAHSSTNEFSSKMCWCDTAPKEEEAVMIIRAEEPNAL